ncbi:Ppx/GppA family phosphatase [Campylobacter coli]|nr:Ppx/GppA family phosphatase [Campylobacter coli]
MLGIDLGSNTLRAVFINEKFENWMNMNLS